MESILSKQSKSLSIFHEFLEEAQHFLNLCGVVFEVLSCVDDQHIVTGVGLEPLLMFVVDHGEVFQRNLALFFSLSFLGPLETLLRGASQVDNLGFLNIHHGFEAVVERFEHFVFAFVHIA
jgi:hypothetical protein